MKTARWLTLAMMLWLASCASNGAGANDGGCSWVRPIFIGGGDTLTPATAQQILAHNRVWKSICHK